MPGLWYSLLHTSRNQSFSASLPSLNFSLLLLSLCLWRVEEAAEIQATSQLPRFFVHYGWSNTSRDTVLGDGSHHMELSRARGVPPPCRSASLRRLLPLLLSKYWIGLVAFLCPALPVSWPSLPGLSGVKKLSISDDRFWIGIWFQVSLQWCLHYF